MNTLLLLVVCAVIGSSAGLSIGSKGCPPGVSMVNCFVDPCQFATCPGWPLAECRSNYCGGCNAEFFMKDKVDCKRCPDGSPVPACKMNPCLYLRPPAGYKCVLDACCGCTAKFVKLDGSDLKECLSKSCNYVKCGYGSTCQINYCNECTPECIPPRKG